MSATYPATTPAPPSPVRAPRRRRRWPYVLLVFLLFLAGAFVVADRVAAAAAQDRIAAKLADRRPFSGRPDVRIHGIPFLTQAVGGRYFDIEVRGPSQPLTKFGSVELDAHLRGVHLKLDAVSNGVTRVPVDRADVRLSFPLGVLARASGIEGLTLTSAGPNVTSGGPEPSLAGTSVTGTAALFVPGIGTVNVTGRGQVSVTDTQIRVSTTDLSVVGQTIPLPAGLPANALGFTVSLAGLPYDARVDSVTVANDTVTLTGHASNIILS